MNNNYPPNAPKQDSSLRGMVSDAMKKRLERIINPPEPAKADKRPKNNLWIANIAFNFLLAFVDIITAITVGTFTMWFYGVLVFGAGYGPVALWEILYVRPYASKNQKHIAIAGAIVGAFSTIGIGILVGVLNVVNLNSLFGSGTIEMIIVISLIVLVSVHVILFGAYYFTDLGITREQKYATSLANHDDTMRSVTMAKQIAQEILTLGADLENEVREGRGRLVGAALTQIGSSNILEDEVPELSDPDRSNGHHP